MALTDRQAMFVREYLVDLNGSQAAIRAGYSPRTANRQASRLLSNADIAEAIAEAKKERADRVEITAQMVLRELGKIAFANMQDFMRVGENGDPFVDLSNLTRDQAAALGEFTVEDFTDGRGEDARDVRRVKIKLNDKRAALVDIGRHLGMFTDKHEHSGPGGKPLAGPTQVVVMTGIPRGPKDPKTEEGEG